MGSIIATLIGWGVPAKFAKPLLIGVGVLLLALTLWGAKALYDRSVVNHHEAQIQQRAAPATDQAATERANDNIANAKHEEDAHNAIHSVPDAVSAAPSHQLACERLRRRGHAPASCGRS